MNDVRDKNAAEVFVRYILDENPLQLEEALKLLLLSPVVEVMSEVDGASHPSHPHELLARIH